MSPDPKKHPGIQVDFFHLESCVFSHAEGAMDLPVDTLKDGDVQIGLSIGTRSDGKGARLTMTASSKSLYNFEIAVIAQFSEIEGSENVPITEFARSSAAISAVFPFLRQVVGDVTQKGRFGPVWLSMINPQLLIPIKGTAENDSPGTPKPG